MSLAGLRYVYVVIRDYDVEVITPDLQESVGREVAVREMQSVSDYQSITPLITVIHDYEVIQESATQESVGWEGVAVREMQSVSDYQSITPLITVIHDYSDEVVGDEVRAGRGAVDVVVEFVEVGESIPVQGFLGGQPQVSTYAGQMSESLVRLVSEYRGLGSEDAAALAGILERIAVGYSDVDRLLMSSRVRDVKSVAGNPVFIAAVRLYELAPVLGEIHDQIVRSAGVEGYMDLVGKALRGEPLTKDEMDQLARLRYVYDLIRDKLGRDGVGALLTPTTSQIEKGGVRRERGVDVEAVLPDISERMTPEDLEKYYVELAEALISGRPLRYRDAYVTSAGIKTTLAEALRRVDVLGGASEAVSALVRSTLKPVLGEKNASIVASAVSGFTISLGLGVLSSIPGGQLIAVPLVAAAVGRGLAELGTVDTEIEREALSNALIENWPLIAAGVAGAIAGGYSGAKLGGLVRSILESKVIPSATRFLESRGRHDLAVKLSRYGQKSGTVTLDLRTEDASYSLMIDSESNTIHIIRYAKGVYEFRTAELTPATKWLATSVGGDDMGVLLSKVTRFKGGDVGQAIRAVDELAATIKGSGLPADKVQQLLKAVLQDENAVQMLLTRSITLKGVGNTALIGSGDRVLLTIFSDDPSRQAVLVSLTRSEFDALPVLSQLKARGLSAAGMVDDLLNGKAVIRGQYKVLYTPDKELRIMLGDVEQAVMRVEPSLLRTAAELESKLGYLSLAELMRISQLTPGIPVPGVTTPFLPVSEEARRLAEAISSAAGGRGVKHTEVLTAAGEGKSLSISFTNYVDDEFVKAVHARLSGLEVVNKDSLSNVVKEALSKGVMQPGKEVGKGVQLDVFTYQLTPEKLRTVVQAVSKYSGRPLTSREVVDIAGEIQRVTGNPSLALLLTHSLLQGGGEVVVPVSVVSTGDSAFLTFLSTVTAAGQQLSQQLRNAGLSEEDVKEVVRAAGVGAVYTSQAVVEEEGVWSEVTGVHTLRTAAVEVGDNHQTLIITPAEHAVTTVEEEGVPLSVGVQVLQPRFTAKPEELQELLTIHPRLDAITNVEVVSVPIDIAGGTVVSTSQTVQEELSEAQLMRISAIAIQDIAEAEEELATPLTQTHIDLYDLSETHPASLFVTDLVIFIKIPEPEPAPTPTPTGGGGVSPTPLPQLMYMPESPRMTAPPPKTQREIILI